MLVLSGTCDRTALLKDYMIAEKVSALGKKTQNNSFPAGKKKESRFIKIFLRRAPPVRPVHIHRVQLPGHPVRHPEGPAVHRRGEHDPSHLQTGRGGTIQKTSFLKKKGFYNIFVVLCFPAERPEQGSCERPPGDLRPDALLHRRGRDEPTGDAGHHALPHHLRRHRVRILRAMHAVRPQPEEAGQVQGARDRAGERLKSGL